MTFDFNKLVLESIDVGDAQKLSDLTNFINVGMHWANNHGNKISTDEVNALIQFIGGWSGYIAQKVYTRYTDYTPIINLLLFLGTYNVTKSVIDNKDDFAGLNINRLAATGRWQNNITILSLTGNLPAEITADTTIYNLKIEQKNVEVTGISIPINAYLQKLHNDALAGSNIIYTNVWPQVQNMTIIEALVSSMQNRLTAHEQQVVGMGPLKAGVKKLLTKDTTPSFVRDFFVNVTQYAQGTKQTKRAIDEALGGIDISAETLVTLASHVKHYLGTQTSRNEAGAHAKSAETVEPPQVVTSALKLKGNLLSENVYSPSTARVNKAFAQDSAKIAAKNSVKTDKEAYEFARTGTIPPSTKKVYIVKQFEAETTANADAAEIIRILKDICSGVRQKPSTDRLAGAAQIASGLKALAGAR